MRLNRGRLIIAAVLATVAGGCSRTAEPPACRWGELPDTAGWPVTDAGPFLFKRPPELHEQPAAGALGYVGLYSSGDRALAFDYGPDAPDPRGRATGGEESWLCETPVGGRPAVVRVG